MDYGQLAFLSIISSIPLNFIPIMHFIIHVVNFNKS